MPRYPDLTGDLTVGRPVVHRSRRRAGAVITGTATHTETGEAMVLFAENAGAGVRVQTLAESAFRHAYRDPTPAEAGRLAYYNAIAQHRADRRRKINATKQNT